MPIVLEEVYNGEITSLSGDALPAARRPAREFLICDYCFWAASFVSPRRRDGITCPLCNEVVSRIPLALGENVSFQVDERRGVELAFTGR